ncbi:hypothetical protein KBT16_26765 [Nostoc sp. CCCryo 231-06]|nr:hypothetical protein [Nostoc sp. CCCryo 231-06]
MFTPNCGFSGAASFNYTISDRQLTSTAKVTNINYKSFVSYNSTP